ncbi:MAG TPA: nuclear transport factor 2 family protein [Micromonosporaceae bacterium]|nr:nuclear transport factor 2 family protein [Micromonosporaceae bacterium]
MTRKYRVGVLALALAAVLGVPSTAIATADETDGGGALANGCEHEVRPTVAAFDAAFFARDLDAFMDYYDEEGILISPSGPVITGKETIREARVGLFNRFDWTASFTEFAVVVEGCKTAAVVSDGHIEFASGFTSDFVNTLTLVRKHGRWLVLVDQSTRKV